MNDVMKYSGMFLVALLLGVGVGFDTFSGENPERPNIVLLTVAPVGAEYLPCYGARANTTPYLCDLASEGTLYERAYTPSGWEPLALEAISTGKYPFEVGVYHELSESQYSGERLSMKLNASGYQVFVTKKAGVWHLIDAFRDFDGLERPVKERHQDDTSDALAGFQVGQGEFYNITETLTAARKPVFIWHHEDAPHSPYALQHTTLRNMSENPEYRFISEYEGLPFGEQSHGEYMSRRYYNKTAAALNTSEKSYLQSLYFENLWWTDRHRIRPLIQSLKASGEYDHTLIIVAGLVGEMIGQNGLYSHLGPYDENLRVPLIVKYPGQTEPRRVSRPVSLIDLAPTILREASITSDSSSFTGIPLQENLRRKFVLSQSSKQRAIINQTHKAVICIKIYCASDFYHFKYISGEDVRINATPATDTLFRTLLSAVQEQSVDPALVSNSTGTAEDRAYALRAPRQTVKALVEYTE